ncbi:pescadillo homolog [Aristolochia californica]|uniref:pescadillo homolog n=1 Tax=Aristolochia californica TaxID=171875 RepID=UPI0035DD095D
MPKHYRPPGKKKEGNAAKYITRTKAIHYLQINLSTFRRLCILKGVFPREPKKKVEGNHKTYYHMKDILFLAHDPLLEKFRDIRSYDKKVKKALAKKNKDLAQRLLTRKPSYTLDRLIKERYPTFIDALRDLDDCLTMVHLFAALPAVDSEHIEVKRIHNCRRLSHEWQAYISRTHKLRKTFISVKGIYYQAEVDGQKITWLTPHALQQVLTDDVDFKVMLTFLEFYETLLAFVNFKLYHSINVKYPPILDPQLEALAADLYALSRYVDAGSRATKLKPEQEEIKGSGTEESDLRLAQLQHQLRANEPGALMHLVEEAAREEEEEEEDKDTRECRSLFKDLKFFLGREVPRESLLFIIPAFGGTVSWDGDGSPFSESDESITHQIVDRPTQKHLFLSREYIQPQWVYDCVNAQIILPTEGYLVGSLPPPHLSPFVDNEAEGYMPEYAETIKRLQAAVGKQLLPMPGTDKPDVDDPHNLLAEGIIDRTQASEAAEKKRKMLTLQKQFHDELSMELQGVTYSMLSNKRAKSSPDETEVLEEPGPDPNQLVEDDRDMSNVMMSRGKRKLYEAMQIGKGKKRANVSLLKERKKKAERDAGKAGAR